MYISKSLNLRVDTEECSGVTGKEPDLRTVRMRWESIERLPEKVRVREALIWGHEGHGSLCLHLEHHHVPCSKLSGYRIIYACSACIN